MDKAKKLIRRLRGKKKYVSSPTGSLPPSPMPGSPVPNDNVKTGTKLRRGRSLSLNKMWRRCLFWLFLHIHLKDKTQSSLN
jgi:hypothetical protein